MRVIGDILKRIYGLVVYAFERADIIPPLIVVSAYHYAGALSGRDPAFVAVILGILIDLGHYRAVKAYLKVMTTGRFAVMFVFTGMTGYFHWLWYKDIALSFAVPVLIIGLALLSKWERWENQAVRVSVSHDAKNAAHNSHDAPDAIASVTVKAYQCELCGASVANLGSHMRWQHPKPHSNGKAVQSQSNTKS